MGEEEKEDILDLLINYQKNIKDIYEWRQLEAIWLKEKLGMSGPKVAEALNYQLQTVHLIWHKWKQKGKEMFEQRRSRGGRNNAHMSLSEEREFLKGFLEKAEEGKIINIHDIKKAYEMRVGKKVAFSTIYRLLKRHGWRKIVPRKKHPKSDLKNQEEVKKTL